MDQWLPAFSTELEKIAVTTGLSSFRQTRRGRRPMRVHNALRKEQNISKERKDDNGVEESTDYEAESGQGMSEGGLGG